MAEEAKVRVRLHTRKAKSDLRDLGKAAEKTGGRASSGVKGALGRGAGMMRKGAGMVKSSIKNTIKEGAGEVLSGITEGITAPAAEYIEMGKNYAAWGKGEGPWKSAANAKVARTVREEVWQRNKHVAHLDSAQPYMIMQHQEGVRRGMIVQEGRSKFLANKAVYGTQEVEKAVTDGFNTVKKAVMDLGSAMLEGLQKSFTGK